MCEDTYVCVLKDLFIRYVIFLNVLGDFTLERTREN